MDFKSFLEYTGHLKPNTAKYSAAHKSSHKNPMKHAVYHDDGKGTSSSVKGGFEHEHEAQAHIKSLKAKGDKRNLVVKRTYTNEEVVCEHNFQVGNKVTVKSSGAVGKVVKIDNYGAEDEVYHVNVDGKVSKFGPDSLSENITLGEDAEEIDEISKGLAHRYLKKAPQDAVHHAADYFSTHGSKSPERKKNLHKMLNRQRGIAKAVDKLANEETIEESVRKAENLITHTMNYDYDSIIRHVARNKTTYDKKTHDHVAKIKHHLSKGDTDKANDHVDYLNNHLHKKHKIERHIHESMANQIRDAEMYMPALKCLEFAKESLKEEEKAVKDYEDRIKNCKDKRLVKILKHLVEEEKHHVKMLKDYIQQVTK